MTTPLAPLIAYLARRGYKRIDSLDLQRRPQLRRHYTLVSPVPTHDAVWCALRKPFYRRRARRRAGT